MKLFLTSSPSGPLDKPNDDRLLDESNGFVAYLRDLWKEDMKGIIISADPDNYDGNDEMCEFFYDCFENSGIPVDYFDCLDHRTFDISYKEMHDYDIIMLAGGHVPTQNAYFMELELKEKLQDYEGIIIGISAGTMNCADIVYAQPELPGESYDPEYERFIEGLGLTSIQVCPHYQMVKDMILDGRRLYEDITYPDSIDNYFIALVDGSYIVCDEEETRVFGQAYLIHDGNMETLCEEDESIQIE